MRRLNLTYRGHDKTTDVLAFALAESSVRGPDQHILGDVVISVERAQAQAAQGDVDAELIRLLVHGFCHLVGFDHQGEKERKAMLAEEKRLLALVVPDPRPLLVDG
jgi:probable rRNA maturation factor